MSKRATDGEVASACGLERSTMTRLRSAQRVPTWPTIRKIADGLKWPAQEQAMALAVTQETYCKELEEAILRWQSR